MLLKMIISDGNDNAELKAHIINLQMHQMPNQRKLSLAKSTIKRCL